MDWALIIASLAFLGWLVTSIPQWIWGRPKMEVYFTGIPYDGLICFIRNIPIEAFPNALNVHRQDICDLHANFEIYEKITHKRLFFGTEYRDLSLGFDNKQGKYSNLQAS